MNVNTMNLSFICKFSSPTNSVVVDSATGERLFEFATPFGLHWRTVTTQGRTMLMSDWLVKKGLSSRFVPRGLFVAGMQHVLIRGQQSRLRSTQRAVIRVGEGFGSPGRRDIQGARPGIYGVQLLDCQTGALVARGHRKRTRLFSSSGEKLNIDVPPDGLPLLDAIVFSFFLCELMARRKESANNGFGVGGAGMQLGAPISG